ncbi:MAG TPA: carbon storage regulator [Pirellulales bacterium]|nr:carbon storage regulator [Pirellulales bacterium]
MLVLSRKVGEKIIIDDQVTLTVTRISGGRVSIGITAPSGVRVVRAELKPLPEKSAATTLHRNRIEGHFADQPQQDELAFLRGHGESNQAAVPGQ